MKRLLTATIILITLCAPSTDICAQQRQGDQQLMRRRDAGHRRAGGCPRAYIGFSTGINNPVGLLGPQVDIAISPSVSIGTGIGLSSWGFKTFVEGRYYFRPCNRGWAIGSGFTYNTGGNNIELQNQKTIYGDGTVMVDLHSQANFMASAYHFFSLGRSGRNRFHLQAGFSVPLGTKGEFIQRGGAPLTSTGVDNIRAIAPGGLILGLGFSFGAGRM